MRKLFPMHAKPTTWHNYSSYLNKIYERIDNWEEYIKFFDPEYHIINETLYANNILNNLKNDIDDEIPHDKNIIPYWIYKVKQKDKDINGNTVYVRNYCFFPSELKFREGYLNTFYKAYLCYFAPPNANNLDITSHEVEISEDQWNSLVSQGKILDFPPSRLIFSKIWAHSGSHFSGNQELQDPSKYLMISKPSACWYLPTFIDGGVSYNYIKNALEDGGSIVSFSFEFAPSRYFIAERTKENSTEPAHEAKWGAEYTSWAKNAGSWDSVDSINAKLLIQTIDRNLWSGSYPIMHRLELRTNQEWSGEELTSFDCEEVITDDVFRSRFVNSNNHSTAQYGVNLAASPKEISKLWESIFVNIC